MKSITVKGLAHITGGGITENLPRILADDVHAEIDTDSWRQGPVFDWIQATGKVVTDEMRRTFNCGIGMIVVVDTAEADMAVELLSGAGRRDPRRAISRRDA